MPADLIGIPPEAICRICGEPMKVVRYEEEARAMGLKVPERGIPSIECHDRQLVIEDDDVAHELRNRLDAYHAAMALDKTRGATHHRPVEAVGHPQRA